MITLNHITELLFVGTISSTIMTLFLQKIKEAFLFKNSQTMIYLSFFMNMTLGTLFAISFTSFSIINCLWIGFFSFIGADTIYKLLEDKLGLESLSSLKMIEEIPIIRE